MAIGKAKRLLVLEFLDNDPKELTLANYLKSIYNAKGKVLTATQAHLYSVALSEDPNSSDEEIELAILESLQSLWGQMNYIVDYHRIKRKIQLTPQSLMRFGLGPIALESIVNPPQPQPLVPTRLPEPEFVAMVEAGKNRQSTSNASDEDILKDFCGDSDSLNLDL
jgi:hypothetical protein